MRSRTGTGTETDSPLMSSPGTSPIYPTSKGPVAVLDMNPQTQWVHGFGFWVLYAFAIFFTRGVTYAMVSDPAWGWTMTVIAHSIFNFVLLHCIKGSAIGDIGSHGQYDHLTFWEQIDGEHHGTPIRRYFTMVPITLLIISMNWVRNDWFLFTLLFGSTALAVIPKLPMFAK